MGQNLVERNAKNYWEKINHLIENAPPLPIVCLSKGGIAVILVERWPRRVIVVDKEFPSRLDLDGVFREVWGTCYAPVRKVHKLIADFGRIQFKQNSLAALFIPELFLLEKTKGLKLMQDAADWVVKGGIVVIEVPTYNDIRFKNLRSFGKTFLNPELKPYIFQEVILGGFKVNPPVPCCEGCDHEYFSFYSLEEIRQQLSKLKECITFEGIDEQGITNSLYVAQKL